MNVSDEARSAAIHALYGWGESLVDANANTVVPNEAIDALRGAVIEVTNRFRAKNPSGVGHAAEFYELAPTGLSTRALRSDLLTAYLGASDYSFCGGAPMPADVCETGRFRGPCRYRDERFCKTQGRNPLQGVFEMQVKAFTEGKSNEAMVWALQNAVEIEAENPLHDEPVVAYNVAKLLHDLKRPDLAYRYIQPVINSNAGDDIKPAMVRLGWVSSILANEKSRRDAGREQQRASRAAIASRTRSFIRRRPRMSRHRSSRSCSTMRRRGRASTRGCSSAAIAICSRTASSIRSSRSTASSTPSATRRPISSIAGSARWSSISCGARRRCGRRRSRRRVTPSIASSRARISSPMRSSTRRRSAVPFAWWKLRWVYYLFALAIVALLARDFRVAAQGVSDDVRQRVPARPARARARMTGFLLRRNFAVRGRLLGLAGRPAAG